MPGIKTDREQYLAETKSGENPGSCMMVPTGADGKDNIGVGHFKFRINHCNMDLDKIAAHVCTGIDRNPGLQGDDFGVPGVSDGISMSYDAMRHSLVSRDSSARAIINHVSGTPYRALILIPGCDKNMPAAAMALLHLDVPGYIMCGGSILPGEIDGKKTDIVPVFTADGEVAAGRMTQEQRERIRKAACPFFPDREINGGACGGMYTANSMFTILEAMGLSPLYSSSTMTVDKVAEAAAAHYVIREIMKHDRVPSQYITRASFENAVRITAVLGGSTNPVLHLQVMAKAARIPFTEDDIEKIMRETPFLGDLMPNGIYRMHDLSMAGGTPQVLKYMLKHGHLDGNARTLTGKTIGEDLEAIADESDKLLKSGVISSFDNPRLQRGHLVLLKGNMGTGWTKVSGAGLQPFDGKAVYFVDQRDYMETWNERIKGDGDFALIDNEGPKTSPGCPEMLRPTTLLIGKFGKKARIGLGTIGRFSGGSVGGAPIVGHMDETEDGGLLGLVRDGERIYIDPANNSMNLVGVSEEEIRQRRANYKMPDRVRARIEGSPADLKEYRAGTTTCREGASMMTRYF